MKNLKYVLVVAAVLVALLIVFSTYQSIMGPSDATRERIRQIQGE